MKGVAGVFGFLSRWLMGLVYSRRWMVWAPGLFGVFVVLLGNTGLAFAAGHSLSGGLATACVGYGTAVGGFNTVPTAIENIAATGQILIGSLALLALVAAGLTNMFWHNPHAKELARGMIEGAIFGMLIAIFAPTLINMFMGIHVGATCP